MGWKTWDLIPERAKILFFLSKTSGKAMGPTKPPTEWDWGTWPNGKAAET